MQIRFSDVPQMLIDKGIVSSLSAANTTAFYLVMWSEGSIDPSKSQVSIHRARLRKIGLDILKPCTGNGSFPLSFETNVKGF